MRSFQPIKLTVGEENTSAFSLLTDDIAVWLDRLVMTLASGANVSWHAAEVRLRLKDIPFGAILSAIERGRPDLGDATEIALYERWIDANNGISPLSYAAWFNIGVSYMRAGDHLNSAIAYNNALALRPDMHGAAINLGLLFEARGEPEQALATWKQAVQSDDVRIALEIQQGRLLEKLGRLEEAETMFRRVLLIDPAQPDVVYHWVHIRQKSCQWPIASSDIPGISPAELVRSSGPLGILALTDDIDLQRDAAAVWVANKTAPTPLRLSPVVPYPHQRIRIGYLSSDFCSHAMSYLITELFERHDRRRFEVFGYCSSEDDATDLRKRILTAFDQYRMIRTLSDQQAAQLIRDDEIDVLIDLNGITDGTRLNVLRWRPAPIQATYLGFIGPIPMPELDYLLCDKVVIPPEYEAAYRPVPLPIARIYQANDSKRTVGRKLSRAEVGLPEDRFVLCCFSKHYKITEEMFAAWMSVLRQANRTVIWLVKDNAYSEAHIRAAAIRTGMAEERLIFSERTDADLYLSRLELADLLLDTFPYNAGTIASDAIRMHLPLITLCGKAFASRMATSLLHAIGASQGITTTLSKYVETAVRLANDPMAYGRYKALFTELAWSQTIGDIAGFTREYEATWCRVVREMGGNSAYSRLKTEEIERANLPVGQPLQPILQN
jgi:predicted O-linked N-acetylglucosamine transferase (SPINDLY family)